VNTWPGNCNTIRLQNAVFTLQVSTTFQLLSGCRRKHVSLRHDKAGRHFLHAETLPDQKHTTPKSLAWRHTLLITVILPFLKILTIPEILTGLKILTAISVLPELETMSVHLATTRPKNIFVRRCHTDFKQQWASHYAVWTHNCLDYYSVRSITVSRDSKPISANCRPGIMEADSSLPPLQKPII
jgi:hypothetical protein